MSKAKYLHEGDIFEVKDGMRIQVTLPEMFVYSNRRKSKELTTTVIEVGEVRDNEGSKKFKTASFKGLYLVTDTKMSGGSSPNSHDYYPDGHHVIARRLDKDGNYDPEGDKIEFYQSGCFTSLVEPEDTPVIRSLKKVVTVQFVE